MNSGSRKRKLRFRRSHPQTPTLPSHHDGSTYPRVLYDHSEILDESTSDNITSKPDSLHALYIQAYEADLWKLNILPLLSSQR